MPVERTVPVQAFLRERPNLFLIGWPRIPPGQKIFSNSH
jgi:hypothetical protein